MPEMPAVFTYGWQYGYVVFGCLGERESASVNETKRERTVGWMCIGGKPMPLLREFFTIDVRLVNICALLV